MFNLRTKAIPAALNKVLLALKKAEEECAEKIILSMINQMSVDRFVYPKGSDINDSSYWTVDLPCEEGDITFDRFEATQAFKNFKADLIKQNCTIQRAADDESYYLITPS